MSTSSSAGRHGPDNANTLMRNPAWLADRRGCTLAMHPDDARALDLEDGQEALLTTEAGAVRIPVEVTDTTRPGMVIMPHGFGLVFGGREHGVNVNRLTSARHRDPIAGTPLHRWVPCRVEAVRSL